MRLARARSALAAITGLGIAGLLAELLLSKHTGDAWQLVPVVLLAAALPLLAAAAKRHRALVRTFQVLCVLSMLSGIVGSWLHYRVKVEFALEREPDLQGVALFRQAMKGINPPLLAPGAMIAIGLLGLLWIYINERGESA